MKLYDISKYSVIIRSDDYEVTENIQGMSLDAELFQKVNACLGNPIKLDSLLEKQKTHIQNIENLNFIFNNQTFQIDNIIRIKNDIPKLSNLDNETKIQLTNSLLNDLDNNKSKTTITTTKSDLKKEYSSYDLFAQLKQLDKRFHSLKPEIQVNNRIPKLFPTWYVENTAMFFGYEVLQLGNIALLWNTFKDQYTEILVIKNIEHNLQICIMYPRGSLPGTDRFNRKDLLQCPLGTIVSEYIVNNSDEVTMSAAKQLLQHKKDAAEIERLESKGNNIHSQNLSKSLSSTTKGTFYSKYYRQPSLATTGLISNYSNVKSPFELKDDTHIKIFAAGQSSAKRDYLEYTYTYDNIQLFINKETYPSKIKPDDTKTFQFNFGLNYPENQLLDNANHNNKNIEHAFRKYSDHEYLLEVKIPWSEIGVPVLETKRPFSLNILSGDSDLKENERNSILSLATDNTSHWLNVSQFKQIKLFANDMTLSRKGIVANSFSNRPIIDGINDPMWNACTNNQLVKLYQGKASPIDHKVNFKVGWDNNNIYFLFTIMDNAINYLGYITKDKCWIIDEDSGELIWKLPAFPTSKNFPTVQVEQDLVLKAGKYSLNYTADRTHSYNGWYSAPPTNDIYGAILFKYSD
ncbi:sugar-binding protein [Sphingobacterium sp. 18053]|uniref:sugar-binding protein n=1 Tax=Sphingobacterium sp. 18053 TaxID=2681401 RepID=UPI001F345C93|nr:sugar-binding protein [Sphingobacterium sp. 18053]